MAVARTNDTVLPMSTATIHCDGAARGNPGPSAISYVIARPGHAPVEFAETIGTATNNVAEYSALVAALTRALDLGLKEVDCFSDSELMVKQMAGEYRVKHPDLIPLYEEAIGLRKRFAKMTLTHVRREQNKRADELGNIALDAEKKKSAPASANPGGTGSGAEPSGPSDRVSDVRVRADAIACLESAAKAWAANGPSHPPAALIWDQLWYLLEEASVLKKPKKK
ncbi:MAG: ribonuclease HI family protein [Gemmataceae bacterium]